MSVLSALSFSNDNDITLFGPSAPCNMAKRRYRTICTYISKAVSTMPLSIYAFLYKLPKVRHNVVKMESAEEEDKHHQNKPNSLDEQ